MNLVGNCRIGFNNVKLTAANQIHKSPQELSRMESSYGDEGGWIAKLEGTNENAMSILCRVHFNTDYCTDIMGNFIDRNVVHKELQTLAKDINIIIKYVFDLLVRKPHLDIEVQYRNGPVSIKKECAKLQIRADEMIFKSVKHDDENGILLLLASKLEGNILNDIPKELINIFATTLFELKLNDAKNACTAT